MKILMRLLYVFSVISFVCMLSFCTKSDPADQTIHPFSNGGNERNMIVVMSDLHLGADLDYAECKENLGAIEKLLKQIKAAPNVKELVIAGDLLDEWYVPATTDTYQGKDQADFMRRIAATNKGVIDAINSIIQGGEILVTYVPGNHDLTMTAVNFESILPGINQARDAEQGLGTYSPAGCPLIAVEHGHRYNFFCAPDPISNQDIAPGTIMPPGYFYTRIAVLHLIQEPLAPAETPPVVTQNTSGDASQNLLYAYWNVWNRVLSMFTIANKFNEKIIVTNVDGFKGNYSVNDLLPYQTTAGGLIDVKLYKGVQDTWDQRQELNHVAVNIPIAQAITNAAKSSESEFQARNQYFLNANSDKRIVIFGHTHDPKIIASDNLHGQKSIYANTGAWIDNNHLSTIKMSFIVVTPQNADASSQTHVKLYSFENEVLAKIAEDSLRY